MKYLLVIQFPYNSENDFDQLISLEENLEGKFKGTGQVDGHDSGESEMNIFIRTTEPEVAFKISLPFIMEKFPTQDFKAAYREETGELYTIIWPNDLPEFIVK